MNSTLLIKQGARMLQSTPCCLCVASVNKPTEMRWKTIFQNTFYYNLPVTGYHGHKNTKLTLNAFKMNF